jgi:hypothetical protein
MSFGCQPGLPRMETTTMLDLGPITRTVASLVAGVCDDQLADPTPCAEYVVGDLVHHLAGVTVAFTNAARKEVPQGARRAGGDASELGPHWRDAIRQDLAALALAWRHPAAYQGQTQAGGIDMSGAEAGDARRRLRPGAARRRRRARPRPAARHDGTRPGLGCYVGRYVGLRPAYSSSLKTRDRIRNRTPSGASTEKPAPRPGTTSMVRWVCFQ